MPRRSNEPPDNSPFEYRPGVGGFPPFGGMYRRGDAAQVPPDRIHLGINIRLANGEMGSRPGLAHVEGSQEEGCITGIFEIDDFAVAIYITEAANPGLDSSGNVLPSDFRIMSFNEEKSPTTRDYWDTQALGDKQEPTPWGAPISGQGYTSFQLFNGTLLTHDGTNVYEVTLDEDQDEARMDVSFLFDVSAVTSEEISSMCVRRERVDDPRTGDEFEADVLYLGCQGAGGGGADILRYDGTSVTLERNSTACSANGSLQIISWKGAGLVASGDLGLEYQEQQGYGWAFQAWVYAGWPGTPLLFYPHGLCEWLGKVVIVGRGLNTYGDCGYAVHWDGTGAPTVFSNVYPTSGNDGFHAFRTPIVSGGSLYFLHYTEEAQSPPPGFGSIFRYTDLSTGGGWMGIGGPSTGRQDGFFIPYRGAMLLFSRQGNPPEWTPRGDRIVLIYPGATPTYDIVAYWPLGAGGNNPIIGTAYEAIVL